MFRKKGIPQAYWVNTGKNEILIDLLQGACVITRIDQNVVYRALAEDPDNIFSLLLVAGYLKTPKKELQPDGSYLCEVSIPNKEIAVVYKSEILFHLMQINEKRYDTELIEPGVAPIFKLGIAFFGKRVKVKTI